MGLDWCVRDKVIPEMKESLAFANVQIGNLNKEIDELWASFSKKSSDPLCGNVFPNDTHDKFVESEEYAPLGERKAHWEDVRSECVISPMQTLGAPRIGFDAAATEYARDMYKDAAKTNKRLKEKYPTVEEYLEAEKGLYVPQLINSRGIGAVTGIFVGAESFRGKCIAYIDWLADCHFHENCYDDREPDELIALGVALDNAADHKEANTEDISDNLKEEIKLVHSAADWCRFWGENGHGMSAWY